MKALKKFYTEQELQDWPESEDFTVPNVCLDAGFPGVGYNYGYQPEQYEPLS